MCCQVGREFGWSFKIKIPCSPTSPQLRPLQRSAFTGAIREALALDWYSRYKRPLCGGGQREEAIPGTYSPTHSAWCGSKTHSRKRTGTELSGGL